MALCPLPRPLLLRLSEPILKALSRTPYTPLEGAAVSVKSILESMLPRGREQPTEVCRKEVIDFVLCCAALVAAEDDDSPTLFWIPKDLISSANSALAELSRVLSFPSERGMIIGLMPDAVPRLKAVIKESCVNTEEDEVIDASSKLPVAYAIVAAHQFRWIVLQMNAVDLPFVETSDLFETDCIGGLSMDSVARIPKIQMTSANIEDEGERYCCSVCLQDFQIGETVRSLPQCQHLFHLPCIDTWLVSHDSCPVCRRDV